MKKYSLFVALLFVAALSVSWSQDPPRKILIIHSYHQYLPWTMAFQEGLERARHRYDNAIDYYFEYMDSSRLYSPLQGSSYARYLAYKYREVIFDAVLADSDEACLFLEEHGYFLQDIPRVYYTGDDLNITTNTFSLVSHYDTAILETFHMAMEQNPGMQEIVIISSEVEEGSSVENIIRSSGVRNEDLRIRTLEDFTFQELFTEIRTLPETSVIFFTPVVFDRTGNRYIPKELLSELAAVSGSPIYTFWSSLMNSGAVCGYMIDGALTAEEMVRAVMDYFREGTFGKDYHNLRSFYDWEAMKKYGLRTKDIPEDAVILNEPENIFVTHFKEILISIIIVILIFLILVLYWLRVIAGKNRQLKEANLLINEARDTAEKLASTDPLTGLLNRRAVMSFITYEMDRQKRTNRSVSLLILDIDHFKKINDTYGHDAGDRVLEKLSKTLTRSSRKIDTVARWGGEEFLMVLSETRGRAAVVLGEKIRGRVMEMTFPSCPGITVSIGIAEHSPGEDFDAWFKRADGALYSAKAAGRNRVVLAEV